MNHLITISFHQQTLVAIEHDGKPYIAMRPIVENLGLAWQVQHRKIAEKFSRRVTILVTRDSIGRLQEILCLPLALIPAFLYSINPGKVKPELRDAIITYQDECTEVLFNHFMNREHTTVTAMEAAHFARHPQWRETRDLYAYGFSPQEIADLQGKHVRNVQKMLIRIRAAGIAINPRRMGAAGLLSQQAA